MDRWTPRESCQLLSHLANSFQGLSEKKNKTWHIYLERVWAVRPFDHTGCQHYQSLHAPLYCICTHTHTHVNCDQEADLCQPKTRQTALFGGGCWVLIAIWVRAPLAAGERRQKVCVLACVRVCVRRAPSVRPASAAASCVAFKHANRSIWTASRTQTSIAPTPFHPPVWMCWNSFILFFWLLRKHDNFKVFLR